MTGRFWLPFVWMGSAFGLGMLVFEYVSGTTPLAGLGVAAVQGLLFGGTMAALNASTGIKQWLRGKAKVELDDGETIEATGLATLNGTGGVLYLTDRHLRFASHPINFGETTWAAPLAAVEGASMARTFGVFPNQLQVEMGPSGQKTITTWERDQWCEAINKHA